MSPVVKDIGILMFLYQLHMCSQQRLGEQYKVNKYLQALYTNNYTKSQLGST